MLCYEFSSSPWQLCHNVLSSAPGRPLRPRCPRCALLLPFRRRPSPSPPGGRHGGALPPAAGRGGRAAADKMVATRRAAARRGERGAPAGGGSGSASGAAHAAEVRGGRGARAAGRRPPCGAAVVRRRPPSSRAHAASPGGPVPAAVEPAHPVGFVGLGGGCVAWAGGGERGPAGRAAPPVPALQGTPRLGPAAAWPCQRRPRRGLRPRWAAKPFNVAG